jgi:Uma2 family endonuclease
MGMPAPAYYTADMVRALPDDGNRYEVVYGELLVTPAPRLWHQEVTIRLLRVLGDYLDREPVGHLLQSPADISWGPDILVQPDLFVAPLAQVRTLEWTNVKDLLLVIEVLSPSSKRGDRFTKRRLYQEQGIPLYWIVDGDEHLVEVWTPDARFPVVERGGLVWHPIGAARALTLQLAELFRPI